MAINQDLQTLLNQYLAKAGQAPYDMVVQALNESPALLASFNQAASAGQLTGIYASPQTPNQPTNGAYFAQNPATADTGLPTGYMVITPNFYSTLGTGPALTDNLTFVLGHELEHLSDAVGVNAVDSSLTQQITSWNQNASNAGTPEDLTYAATAYVSAQLSDEGTANIQGWNDEVSAAVAANQGNPLTQQQLVDLVQNYNSSAGSYGSFFFSIGVDSNGPGRAFHVNCAVFKFLALIYQGFSIANRR